MVKEMSTAALAARLEDESLALLDVREVAEYNLAHIPHFGSLPRRLIEARLGELVPWRGTAMVLADDDGRRAALAARTVEAMGYRSVSVLSGGTNRWVSDGYATEW